MAVTRLAARLAKLERLAPAPPEPWREMPRWFTHNELRMLTDIDDPAEFDQLVEPLAPVAEARRAAGVNMTALDQAERDQERIIYVADPDGQPNTGFCITVFPDPLRAGQWRADDDWYREKWGRRWPLPVLMTEAEIEARCPYQPSDRRCRCSASGERHEQ